jgi:hypothetical protein
VGKSAFNEESDLMVEILMKLENLLLL